MKPSIYSHILTLIIGIFIGQLITINSYKNTCNNNNSKTDSITISNIVMQPSFIDKTPKEGLLEALQHYNIKYPKIVYAQAILETGHFRSNVCLNYNNLFGLYNSKIKDYYKFNHWSESVEAYIKYIQYKHKDNEDYYAFLDRINYAEDPNYINKLKTIVNKLN